MQRIFFQKPTLWVAKNLLGRTLIRRWRGREIRASICETEAYVGENDLACHASKGRTKRSEVLFAKAGTAYVYLIYGMHYCFNVVTEKSDFPAAVLIRAVSIDGKNFSGPGRVCKALHIDKRFHGQNLIKNKELRFERRLGGRLKFSQIKSGPRIGVEYAGAWAKKPWRFWTIGERSVK
ncbi:MAG: DNA-3-methyladenine glycosylase [Patescibacteria group bacterium]